MISLEGTRTDANLRYAYSEEGRFDSRYLTQELAAEAAGFRELAALSRVAAANGADVASGHLDYLVADDDRVASSGDIVAR